MNICARHISKIFPGQVEPGGPGGERAAGQDGGDGGAAEGGNQDQPLAVSAG